VLRLSESASGTDSLCYPILFLYQFYLHRAVTNLISPFSLQRRAVGWGCVPDRKWPIVPVLSERNWSICWNENWQGKPKYSEVTCPNPTLSTNPTWSDLSLYPNRRTTDAYCKMMCYRFQCWARSANLADTSKRSYSVISQVSSSNMRGL
jgi:hypothetical protein